jgi:hypothetical protein
MMKKDNEDLFVVVYDSSALKKWVQFSFCS